MNWQHGTIGRCKKFGNRTIKKLREQKPKSGIAVSVISEIEEDGEEIENVLGYYLQEVYWSLYSREMKDASIVTELVKQYIEEL